MPIKHPIKAFTVFELLLSMALSAILVAFAFMGFNQMQKLLHEYNAQSTFISDMNQLHSALFNLSHQASAIEKQDENTLLFRSDSAGSQLLLHKDKILLKFASHTDTFHLEPKEAAFTLLQVNEQVPSKLLKQFDCTIFFKNQKFHVSFQKQYDTESVLKSTLELLPPDELN